MPVSPEGREKQIKKSIYIKVLNKLQSTEQIFSFMITWSLDMAHLRKDRIIQILVTGTNLYDKKGEKGKEKEIK